MVLQYTVYVGLVRPIPHGWGLVLLYTVPQKRLEQQCELLHANEDNSQGYVNSNTLSSHQQLKMTHMKVFELSYRRDDGALVEKEA